MAKSYMLMEEDLMHEEVLISMHPDWSEAQTALIRHLVKYRKINPYCQITKVYNNADYSDKGLVWWRIKTFDY